MPSWMWVLIFLLIVTGIVLAVLWSSGILSAADQSGQGDRSRMRDGAGATERDPPQRPADRAPTVGAGRAPLVRTAAPPPAMAGATPAGEAQRSDMPARGMTRPAEAGGLKMPPPPNIGRASPPPAAAASTSRAPQSNAEPTAARTSKPPPVQAAWSTPSTTAKKDNDRGST
ncbi:MAG: hypothetical protein K2X41_09515 [Hyphomicrobium sp.]|nr:hypothetical protein [Hyphomicrobium sp.]